MGLEQQLEDFRQEFLLTTPAGRPALYEANIEVLRSSFAPETTASAGTVSPDFRLPDARDDLVCLTDLVPDGPVVVSFYRGGWCPCCNIQLRASGGPPEDGSLLTIPVLGENPATARSSRSEAPRDQTLACSAFPKHSAQGE
jgi:hypothetical protein